ncbi:hypothetical protein Q5752_001988 [Cryptotrichosporon argae]
MSTEAAQKETHVGTCHCQRIKFTVHVPPLTDNGTCDCSHCAARGIVWAFCDAADFTLERGKGAFREYEFGAKSFKHLSCATCGTYIAGASSAATFPESAKGQIGFNVRALRDVDMHELSFTPYSGANREPAYVRAPPFVPDLELKSGQVVVPGACHCQAVQFAVRTLPLEHDKGHNVEVLDCNCSICAGNGAVWAYPEDADFVLAPGAEAQLQIYTFAPPELDSTNHFASCKTCSCLVYEKRRKDPYYGVNVRLMDVNLAKVNVQLFKWRQKEPMYQVR